VLLLLEEGTHTAAVEHFDRLAEGIPVALVHAAGSTAGILAEKIRFLVAGTDSME
jgi:hypothetical protein